MELFIKRFIDLLDEVSPVSMVRTLIEQPLGAVMSDAYVRIHSRLALADEDSPFVEVELYPYETNKVEILYAYTFPKDSITISEEEFIAKILKEDAIAERVVSLQEENNYYFEVFYEEDVEVTDNNGEIDKIIHDMVTRVKKWLTLGGYEIDNEE